MKVAVVGNGNVGMAVFAAMQTLPEVTEIALVGRNKAKINAEIVDYQDALVLRNDMNCHIYGGGYELCEDADILVYTAGVGRKEGQSRLDLVNTNVEVAKSIFAQIDKYSPNSKVVVLSNPVDIITTVVQRCTSRPANYVIGTGTYLDTARLKRYISGLLDVSSNDINGYVLGEHGNSSVAIWSSLRIAGMEIDEYLSNEVGMDLKVNRDAFIQKVRQSGGEMIKGKGFTAYGVAAAACRVVSAIVNDTREILPLTTVLAGEYGVNNMAISVPCMIGRTGRVKVQKTFLNEEEQRLFNESVKILSDTLANVEL